MLRLLAIGLVLASVSLSAQAQAPYATQTVTAAQEALIRLGYDVGEVDGEWGKKARTAMNDLRDKNGLPPAQDFVGSSLALVHKLSPGPTTLPNPGLLVTDPKARQSVLPKLKPSDPKRGLCTTEIDGTIADLLAESPVEVVSTSASGNLNYITAGDDWFTPVMQNVMAGHNACVAGDTTSCEQVVKLMSNWADADALRPGVKRSQAKKFDDVSWIGNSLIRNFIFAYADARRLVSVDAPTEAAIVDWFKSRVDDYWFIPSSGHGPGSIVYVEAGNHAMADMMASQVLGALIGDRSMLEGAFDTWQIVLSEMREDGSFPNETRRGARSLHYTTFQISQLLAVEAVARSQGIDLFLEHPETANSIPKAVAFLLDAYENFDKVTPYAQENEGAGPSNDYTIPIINPMHLGWLPAYRARFGEDDNIKRMRTLMIDERICSKKAMDEVKLTEPLCENWDGRPPLSGLTVVWDTTDMPNMGYSAACLQGTNPYVLARYEANTPADFSALALTNRYDGATCSVTISRGVDKQSIAKGNAKVQDGRLILAGGWSTGGKATGLQNAQLGITEEGRIVGQMTMYAEDSIAGEGPNLGSVLDFADATGALPIDGLPEATFEFALLGPSMPGALEISKCMRIEPR